MTGWMNKVTRTTQWGRRLPFGVRLLCGVMISALGVPLHWALYGCGASAAPYVLFYPPVLAAALLMGRWPAMLGSVAALLLSDYLYMTPPLVLSLHKAALPTSMVSWLVCQMAIVLIENLAITSHSLSTANDRLKEQMAMLTRADHDKNTMLHEVLHRHANDLQRLSSLLDWQAHTAPVPAAAEAYTMIGERVAAMGSLNQRITANLLSDRAGSVNIQSFLIALANDLQASIGLAAIAIEVQAEAHPLPHAQAGSLGALVTELVTNAVKYAFPEDRQPGLITISFRQQDNDFVLQVVDDGIGMDIEAPARGTGMGRRIIKAMVGQLHGRVQYDSDPQGTACMVRFPIVR